MNAGYIKFNSIPEIGFVHHYYSSDYMFDYERRTRSFEIVYINSGAVAFELEDKIFRANEGDVLVLFRHLPIKLYACGNTGQSHCTVQLHLDYDFELVDSDEPLPDDGLALPFVTHRSKLTEEIKKDLYDIVHKVSEAPDRHSFRSSLKAVEILHRLDEQTREMSETANSSHTAIASLAEAYIKDNINNKIRLEDISAALGKSPNYINYAFKKSKGTTLTEYINGEKIKLIATLMQKENMHFSVACSYVGISDSSYGYRLFKKHTGLTPKMFLKSDKMLRK